MCDLCCSWNMHLNTKGLRRITAVHSSTAIPGSLHTPFRNSRADQSHPTAGVARFKPKVPDQLSSSSEEQLPVGMNILRVYSF